MSATPLHVQVAAALGWEKLHPVRPSQPDNDRRENWVGVEPHGGQIMIVPRYDSGWCSAGPLCERFNIGVMWDHGQWIAQHMTEEGHDQYAGGDKPTEAISRLVVHLHKEGKLKV